MNTNETMEERFDALFKNVHLWESVSNEIALKNFIRKELALREQEIVEKIGEELIMSMPSNAENLSNLTPENAKITINNFLKRLTTITKKD